MVHLLLVLLASVASAVVVPERVERVIQPGSPVKRMVANGGPFIVNGVIDGTPVEVRVAISGITPAASLEDAKPSACTPYSVCFDGITCSQRYGGCYDENNCNGTPSYPIPTCTDDVADGLTQNRVKREVGADGNTS